MSFDKLGSVQVESVQFPYGPPPVPSAGYTNLYRKTEDDPTFYYLDSTGTEHEFNADGLSKLASGNGVQISVGEDGMVYIAILQSPHSIGMIALDSLNWNPASLPTKTTTLLNKAILVLNEGVAGFKSTERITFTDLLNLLSSRARFVDVPAGPQTPGVEGDYSYKEGYRYQYMQIGVGQYQWVRWQVQTTFQNEGGSTIPVPTNLQASLSGSNINLTWGYASSATSFELFASSGDASNFQKVDATIGGTDRAYLFTPPSSDMQYYFEVRAITSQGTSGVSNRANAISPPAANRWAAVQNLQLTPNSSNSSIQATFTALNAGTTVRFDITGNVNAQADPLDPSAQGWQYHGALEITSLGAKTYTFPNIADTNPRKVRALVFGPGKDASVWVMQGPVSLSTGSQLPKPGISGVLNSGLEALITVTPSQSGVLALVQRRPNVSSDWQDAGLSSTNYTNISCGTQAAGSTWYYRARYVTEDGQESAYSDEISLTAQAQSKLAAPKNLIACHLGNGTVQMSFFMTNRPEQVTCRLQISSNADFSLPTVNQQLSPIYRFGDQSVVINYGLESYMNKTMYARVQAYDVNGVALPSDWVTLTKALTSALDMAVVVPSISSQDGVVTMGWDRIGNLSPVQAWVIDQSVDQGSWVGLHTTASNATTSFDLTPYFQAGKFNAFRMRPKFSPSTLPWNYSSVLSIDQFNPDPGGSSDGVTYSLASKAEYESGNHDPWATFGYFENPFVEASVVWDFIGGAHPLPLSLSSMQQRLSSLGVHLTGIYSKTANHEAGLSDWTAREAKANRYLYLGQAQYEATNPKLSHEYLPDNNPTGFNQDWTLDDGGKINVPAGQQILWNIIWAYWHRGNIPYNGDFHMVRPNVEGHEVESWNQVLKVRYLGQGGRYRPARVGGSFAGDGNEPAYKDMSDLDFYIYYHKCQVSYDEWWYSRWKNEGALTIGYQAESSPGFFQDLSGVRGYRRTYLFNATSFNNKKYRDFMTAVCRFGGDIQLDLMQFVLVYTDEMDGNPEVVAYHMADDLGLQEDNVARTGNTVGGSPEYYRYSISSTGLVTIYFEDRLGNSVATTRPMRIESALTKDTTGYGGMQVWATIPLGSTQIQVQTNNQFLVKESLSERVDDKLVDQFEYMQLYYLDMVNQGLEGYPIQNQVYGYVCGYRGSPGFNLEVTNVGQMPKQFAHGLRMMGYWGNYMHVMYNTLSINGLRTSDHIYAVQKRMNKYNSHWNAHKKAMMVEVSMDGGTTWTSSDIATWRNDISSDFLVHNPAAYNALWIRNRRANNQPSPLVYASYNTATGTIVICEKALYTTSMTYSFRFKKPDNTYATFLNRQITGEWKDSWG